MRYFQSIVIGGGLAGLRAAIELNRNNVPVAVLTRVHPVRSHSGAAQGGVNAALGNHERGVYDSVEKHAFDTVKGSDYLADQDAVLRMCAVAPERIYELEHWGCPFSRTPEGRIAQRPFGGAGFPRTCYAGDKTGMVMLHTLYEQVVRFEQASERNEMTVLDEWVVTHLITDGGTCRGVVALDLRTGTLEAFISEAVIFGTGGSGRVYRNSTNALISTAHGVAVPYWAGVPLKDMEFVQFHPTTLVGTNILMTEGCRGEGGYLLNNKGERFMAFYDDSKKAMEVAPRDITARNIMREIAAGRGFENSYVHLDIRHLGEQKIAKKLPGIRDICVGFLGIDPVRDPIPVQPGQHYSMGGIDTGTDGVTVLKGLYAAGECACVSVHGANRLGGNSLLDTIVFGAIAGKAAGEYVAGLASTGPNSKLADDALKKARTEIESVTSLAGAESISQVREDLAALMTENVGVFRERTGLSAALEGVKALKARFLRSGFGGPKGLKYNFQVLNYYETKANLDVAEAIVAGALEREESRGSHFRTDFPSRDDARFLKHTLSHFGPDGPRLEHKPVTLGKWEPKERKY
jgi:succinate dehydrogenase / fumarate reductase flavoprotein subunit